MDPCRLGPLPPLEIDWGRHVRALGLANRQLAYFNGVLRSIPNPHLLLSPMITQEAVLSSRIEGTQATLGDVLRFEAGEGPAESRRQGDIGEVLNYRKALHLAAEELTRRPFNLNLLLAMHEVLLGGVRGETKARGRFRREQNWIGAPGCSLAEADYVPPEWGDVPGYLDAWEKYYHADAPDPLVQLAVIHARFEQIHPFLDGNGRLGRILIPLFLHEKGLLSLPVFYMSAWLERHRGQYIEGLRSLCEGKWNEWISFFLAGVADQAEHNAKAVEEVGTLYDRLRRNAPGMGRSPFAIPLLEAMFRMPIFAIAHLPLGEPRPSRSVVASLVKGMVSEGVVTMMLEGSGRRPALYAFPELIAICDQTRE